MKGKTLAFSLIFSLCCILSADAQLTPRLLPQNTVVAPYLIEVGCNTTTLLIFPFAVIDADRGFTDIVIEKQKGVENVLKVKGISPNFQPTNVHVYTNDGKVYGFRVHYAPQPFCTTFDLGRLQDSSSVQPGINFSNQSITSFETQQIVRQLKDSAAFFSRKKVKNGIGIQLQTIHVAKDQLFFGLTLINNTRVTFDVDFVRMYIIDQKKGKRTSFQRQDITPIYTDTLKRVNPITKPRYMLSVDKFTIPDKKEFIIELFEKNGGRHIALRIKNRHLLRAKLH